MMIMDAGVHVWRPQAPDRPWMPGRKAHLPEPLTYEKFGGMMKGELLRTDLPWLDGSRQSIAIQANKNAIRVAVLIANISR
jgi:predicted TIM-barrel fold metal-dependent hydrolase